MSFHHFSVLMVAEGEVQATTISEEPSRLDLRILEVLSSPHDSVVLFTIRSDTRINPSWQNFIWKNICKCLGKEEKICMRCSYLIKHQNTHIKEDVKVINIPKIHCWVSFLETLRHGRSK